MAGLTHDHENPFKSHWSSKAIWIGVLAYLFYSFSSLGISIDRIMVGIGESERLLSRMFPPDFSRTNLLLSGLAESLQIAIISSFFGIVISLVLGLLAARNMMPLIINAPVRGFIALCRSFHPVIIAILFVKAVGFGALAGILTLVFASIGFIAKLFAEAIEEISFKQVEAIRATGASFASVVLFAVMPQVFSRFIGFSSYQLDSNLRNSTMVGIVGAGGLGGTLFSAFQRFDYDFVAAILITIISLILIGEFLSNIVRRIF
ncbi:putative PhnE phosphonate ABC transporter,permease [Vibrio nigripulchritudo SFn27]|uniref:Putative PhnE phosphonate ABC transporter, permease n=1 Tax=Vibrio nigripulchritudo TaxID=28173 RepID=U4KIM5_9VIBR|nr:phosphonate ABC transporter, permease protein PhnE [Vibrio nigripulchritudo]CCN81546.1 putative PhnE phosphonate ABC transporter,permease [Vibrio nigripulchritudo BLFn1]CCN91643.1 putative PhnE phosphonate ABC transporter,permease [Vibrio nigripulchritudo SFn27]CCN96527.1 putative PhnE phosphonate ABC transporter,permease [Vibrio nigripulchritudo ENn2]CCO38401.1 putative PhnE phosphonate ABC transporter,permease [Vibrio nigripulchritudo SFn135]CCO53858.1 putative PhnE phosphonate ABC transp